MTRTVLVTGANRGLGLEFVRQYAAGGAEIIATCRHPDNAAELASVVAASQGRVTLRRLDVTSEADTRDLIAALGDRAIDVFLCNAGMTSPLVPVDQVDKAGFLEVMNANVMGPLRLAASLADRVAASERKTMAFLSSRMGSVGANDRGGAYVYRASKAALNAVVKSLSIDFAPRGIVSILLHPGAAKTRMAGARGTVEVADSVAGMIGIIDGAGAAQNGRFYDYTGQELPW